MRNLKSFKLSLLFLSATIFANAQDTRCPITADLAWMQTHAPDRYQRFINLENFTANYVNQNARLINGNGLIVIPVVVHVLHRGEIEGTGFNISMAQIQSQIDVLNKDYRRLNDDRVNTPTGFLPVASDFTIQFQLACIDPNGNPTNGVVRKYTSKSNFYFSIRSSDGTPDEETIGIKVSSTGDAAWPTDHYLNIWVCNLAGDLGYSTFPADYSAYPQFDGIVIRTTAFGTTGNVSAPYNLGRTATHEIGHWLNLRHLNGDAFCGDDFVADTPAEQLVETICRTYPSTWNLCNQSDPSAMFMNFLEFTPDNCMNLFTNGQRTRIRAVFATGGPRASGLNGFFGFAGQPTSISCKGTLIVSPMCVPVTWNVSGQAYINSGQNTNKIELVATSNGTAHVTATWGNYTASTDVSVSVSGPLVAFTLQPLDPNHQFCTNSFGNTVQIEPEPIDGVTSFQWGYSSSQNHIPPTVLKDPGTYDYDYIFTRGGQYQLFARPENSCGLGNVETLDITVSTWCGLGGFSVSPNPAQDFATISNTTSNSKVDNTNSQTLIYKIRIIDATGATRSSYEFQTGIRSTKISLANLNSGLYLVSVFDGQQWYSKQLVVQK